MFSTLSPEMVQKFLNGVRKSLYRSWRGKLTVYKIKNVIFSKSTNKNIKTSYLPKLKYILLITLKSDI